MLLYTLATCEGILLGPLLEAYVSEGMGSVLVTTAVVGLLAGLYAATTDSSLPCCAFSVCSGQVKMRSDLTREGTPCSST
jgi:FtsH-binding integral membrane protein